MPKVKLSYFDFPGGRGEDCRIALHAAGVDFEDDRIPGKQWSEHRGSMPFNAMPVMEIEGKGQLAQSNVILRFIGENHDLHPTDKWESARHASVMESVEELRAKVTPTTRIEDDAEKKVAREELASGYMQNWAKNVAAFVDGPFLSGDKLNVADLKVHGVMKWFKKGGVDHISPDVFSEHPKLEALYDAVANHEAVQSWYAK